MPTPTPTAVPQYVDHICVSAEDDDCMVVGTGAAYCPPFLVATCDPFGDFGSTRLGIGRDREPGGAMDYFIIQTLLKFDLTPLAGRVPVAALLNLHTVTDGSTTATNFDGPRIVGKFADWDVVSSVDDSAYDGCDGISATYDALDQMPLLSLRTVFDFEAPIRVDKLDQLTMGGITAIKLMMDCRGLSPSGICDTTENPPTIDNNVGLEDGTSCITIWSNDAP